jgi:colanic acid/amylovoran biosynthesis glycosyltransferase
MFIHKKRVILLFLFFLHVVYGKNHPHKNALNILFVVGNFPAPSQIFILNIITRLIDQGHKISIFSINKNKENLLHMHSDIEKYKLLKHVTYGKLPQKLPDYDIIFCQFGYLGKKMITDKRLSQWLTKRKLVVCFRGSDLTAYLKQSPGMYKELFKKADLFLPVCDYFRKKLIALGCKESKIVVHHSAIDCSRFFFATRRKPEHNKINFVSVSRLVKKKGIDDALYAFAEIVRSYPRVHYSIIGDGSERNYLELLIHQLNLQDHVTLHGWKTHDEIIPLLDQSHIFMLPSRKASDGNEEGIPNALKEAMAMGLISIGTWHAGTPELIDDGISGFLVEEKNISQLTDTMRYIIEHPQEWESIGYAGRKKVEKEFETEQATLQLEKLFYDLFD